MPATCLSIVVAFKDAEPNLDAVMARLEAAAPSDIEVLVVTAGPAPSRLGDQAPGVRILESASDALVPHLWRDGVLAARGDYVALTTAQCLPAPDWVQRLRSADMEAYVGVGGVIDMDPSCDAAHRAVFFQRYLAFSPPQASRDLYDIAADNAVYRRGEILRHKDLLADGFWEPSFHRRFEASGLKLRLDADLKVVYRGCERPVDFAAHRFVHARAYGRARSATASPLRRLQLLATSPLVPVVLLTRVLRRAGAQSRIGGPFISALPWSLAFIFAWSAGEMVGYLDGLLARAPEGVAP